MKKLLASTFLICTLILTLQVGAVSAAELSQKSTSINYTTASVIINNYTAKVGLTQVLSGSSYEVVSGSWYATIRQSGTLINVTGISRGTIVVNVYYANGSLKSVNNIKFY